MANEIDDPFGDFYAAFEADRGTDPKTSIMVPEGGFVLSLPKVFPEMDCLEIISQ